MDGNGWESYCQKLLRIRYQDYQEVPAQFGGDLGIEGFTFTGLVFQCYCTDEDKSGKDLYEAQRDKITLDIAKLIKNAAKITALGAGIVGEWQFLTPYFNSRHLIDHCRAKELEVRRKNLPTIRGDFRIVVKTEDDYIPERQICLGMGGLRVEPFSQEPQSARLAELLGSDNEIVVNIKTKVERLALSSTARASLIEQLVKGYVVGQNELESLNEKFPSTYRDVLGLKSAIESQLQIRTLASTGNHGNILDMILEEYEEKLSRDFSERFTGALIARLSTEAISDWLGRCPLNPNPEDNNANR